MARRRTDADDVIENIVCILESAVVIAKAVGEIIFSVEETQKRKSLPLKDEEECSDG